MTTSVSCSVESGTPKFSRLLSFAKNETVPLGIVWIVARSDIEAIRENLKGSNKPDIEEAPASTAARPRRAGDLEHVDQELVASIAENDVRVAGSVPRVTPILETNDVELPHSLAKEVNP